MQEVGSMIGFGRSSPVVLVLFVVLIALE